MSAQNSIKCPNCGTKIDIDEIFYHQIEEKFKQQHLADQKKLQDEIEAKRKEYKTHLDTLKVKEDAFKEEKEKFEDALAKATKEQVQAQLKIDRKSIEDELKLKIVSEQSDAMASLQKELSEKSEQVKELNNSKIEIEKLKREKSEVESKVKADAQIAMSKQLSEEKEKMQKALDEANALKFKEKDEQMEQLKRSLDDAKRKAEQGSMQIQGEALELAIESWLSSQFPFDTVDEVKKGAFGADCVQTIHTRELQNCGVICYESKNTKAWSDGWISKLKQDMLKVNADLGVLVTSVYPNGMDRMGFVDGIWVCSLDEFKGSVSLLRESLIRVHQTVQKEENRGDKMILLYNYLTGNEFGMQMKSIVDGFMTMQTELDKERRSLMASWKRRQKLIDGVLQNTTEMYGSLQGIAGSGALGYIEALELPDGLEDVE
ncbi:MAG: DUF2130 domain-containing protein [Sulfurovum sp.]|uniref:DUF2130 domain-containing protein n=1 Tax=Sulfurovum sp. TaxID=1969726 RepID=UPI002867B553|nr:DUF2130 domain-containing protein [Sulfurovum sp.]MCO4845357.1 DUF2130 domain-containing protein [Sulfurovum sp.]